LQEANNPRVIKAEFDEIVDANKTKNGIVDKLSSTAKVMGSRRQTEIRACNVFPISRTHLKEAGRRSGSRKQRVGRD
jgi:hypothetical protein